MTKEQLMHSYPNGSTSADTVGVLAILILLLLATVIYFVFRLADNRESRVLIISVSLLLIFSISVPMISSVGDVSKKVSQSQISSWVRDDFYLKYLRTIPTKTYQIQRFSINSDKTVNLTLMDNTTLSHLNSVEFFVPNVSRQKPYMTAKYVAGLSGYSIPDGYYDVMAYIPYDQRSK